jgi:quinol-cytochrome oxidoreductase complex cytochrome b subunit
MLDVLRVLAVVLVAIAMSAGFAHLLALPNKIGLRADEYLTVQQIYRGWARLGAVILAAIVTLTVLGILVRREPAALAWTIAALAFVVLTLAVFFTFTEPANRATENWTRLPENWDTLRRRWEYSHAVSAILYLAALVSLTLSLLHG